MSNQSFRERMGIAEANHPTAFRIIANPLQAGLIKLYAPENKSKTPEVHSGPGVAF